MSRLSNVLHGTPLTTEETLQDYGETLPTAQTPQPKKRSSGLSTHQRSAGAPVSEESTEAVMYNLPLEELRHRANAQLRDTD